MATTSSKTDNFHHILATVSNSSRLNCFKAVDYAGNSSELVDDSLNHRSIMDSNEDAIFSSEVGLTPENSSLLAANTRQVNIRLKYPKTVPFCRRTVIDHALFFPVPFTDGDVSAAIEELVDTINFNTLTDHSLLYGTESHHQQHGNTPSYSVVQAISPGSNNSLPRTNQFGSL